MATRQLWSVPSLRHTYTCDSSVTNGLVASFRLPLKVKLSSTVKATDVLYCDRLRLTLLSARSVIEAPAFSIVRGSAAKTCFVACKRAAVTANALIL